MTKEDEISEAERWFVITNVTPLTDDTVFRAIEQHLADEHPEADINKIEPYRTEYQKHLHAHALGKARLKFLSTEEET